MVTRSISTEVNFDMVMVAKHRNKVFVSAEVSTTETYGDAGCHR